jgi:hypothetical protein
VFRSKTVIMQEPIFVQEAEQHGLGDALQAWRLAAEGDVASAALMVKIAEERLSFFTAK